MQEVDIEELLAFHPYLISEKLEGLIPERQLCKRNCRLDLAFRTKQGLSIVELKKVELAPKHISQLLLYCRIWETSKTPLAQEHYLIGKKPKNKRLLDQALTRCKRKIHTLFFGEDIPTILMMQGRKYEAYDDSVYASNIVQIRF